MELSETIRQFIIENFLFEEDEDLKEDTSFLEGGIIDSTGILELVTFIEETFDITVEDEELIVPVKDVNIAEEKVVKYCMKNLEPFMVPKYVEFRDSFPKSASGKIDKKQLN